MRIRTISIVAACVLATGTGSAFGGGYETMPSGYDWTGFYIGGNVGYGWAAEKSGKFAGATPGLDFALESGIIPLNLGLEPEGVFGGGQVGFNWEFAPRWVVGVEADIQASDFDDSRRINLPGDPTTGAVPTSTSARVSGDWFGTVRGRAGYVGWWDTFLYFTGGLAYADTETRVRLVGDPSSAGDFSGKDSGTQTGWTIGGGAEHKWSQRVSTKLEYLFVDLNSSRVRLTDPEFTDGCGGPCEFDYKLDHSFHVVRVGLNFSFGEATPEATPLK